MKQFLSPRSGLFSQPIRRDNRPTSAVSVLINKPIGFETINYLFNHWRQCLVTDFVCTRILHKLSLFLKLYHMNTIQSWSKKGLIIDYRRLKYGLRSFASDLDTNSQ